MKKINLLPLREIRKLEIRQFEQLFKKFSVWIIFFIIIFVIFLFSVIFSLSIILNSQEKLIEEMKNDSRTQYLTEIEDKIRDLNKNLAIISSKQKEIIVWTPIIEELSQIIPKKSYLTSISYQSSNNRVNMSGIAETRDIFLDFQEKLEESPCFSEIEAPLSNLIKQQNVDFIFNLKPNSCSYKEDDQ